MPISVTALVHACALPFDADVAIRNWPMKRMEFVINGVEMSDEAIELKWDTNKKVQAARGTLMCPAESSCERVRIHRRESV